MTKKPTYEELEQKVKELEGKLVECNRVEGLLNKERGELISIFDSIDEAIYISDPETYELLYTNASTKAIFGQDIIGKKCYRVFQNLDTPCDFCSNHIIFGENIGQPYIWELQNKINRRWYRCIDKAISWPDDRMVRYELAIDIHDLKEVEEALKESEERYRTLFQNNHAVMLLIDPETTDIVDANPAACSYYGYSKEEITKKKITDINILPKETIARERELAMSEQHRYFLFRHRLATGEIRDVEVYAGPIKIRGREILFSIIHDITDRKLAEEALQESERKYRSVVEDSIQGIIITQASIIQFANQAAAGIFGYSKPDELLGLNIWDTMIAPEYHSELQDRHTDIEDGKSIPIHPGWQGIRKDGARICVQSTGSQHLWQGRPAVLTYLLDITDYKKFEEEKKRLEAQLQHAQRMESIGTLAGGLAHNFNNLLMSIIGNASIILLDLNPDHPHYKNLKNIEKSVKSGSKLTRQLLGYAREGKYEVRPINLNPLVKETSDTFGTTRKEIMVYRDLADKLFGIKVDQGQIGQVLMNLYVNAADAMPGGGDLFLKTMNVTDKDMKNKPYEPKLGNYILLTLRDIGVGMDEKTMERIFDPFFTTKGLAEGTGLGLASAYGIIKAHGGYIDVYSEEGKGTTFEIYLPASEEEITEEKMSSDEIIKGKGTILLVDDEEMVLDAGEQMLRKLGYEVLLAGSGQEALELYRENQYGIDVVLLDMVMPGVGGGKTYDRLKEMNPKVKVLLSSGYSIDGEANEILKRGCNGFIQKPFSMEQLSQNIRKILES